MIPADSGISLHWDNPPEICPETIRDDNRKRGEKSGEKLGRETRDRRKSASFKNTRAKNLARHFCIM